MRLDTERIIEDRKYPNTDSQIIKYSQEYCVLAALRYFFPDEFANVNHSDHPDLKCDDYGIEVVSVVDGHERSVEKLFDEYKKAWLAGQDTNQMAKKMDNKYSIDTSFERPRLKYPISTADKERILVQRAIEKKIKFIAEYKAEYSHVDLAVFFTEIPTSECLERLLEWTQSSLAVVEERYGRIFFISSRNLTVIETDNWVTRSSIDILPETWKALRKIGKLTAEGVIKLTDAEWN